jgi:acyl-CoA thioesterase FadM
MIFEDRPGYGRRTYTVAEEWTASGHMTMSRIATFLDEATDTFRDDLRLGAMYSREHRRQMFVADAHIRFVSEIRAGDTIRTETRLVALARNRLHLLHEIHRNDMSQPTTIGEMLVVHVDMDTRRACVLPDERLEALQTLLDEQRGEALSSSPGMRVSVQR